MLNFILRWVINAIALLIVTYLVSGIEVTSFWTALLVIFFLSIINATIRPLILILTLPINILTLGIFTLFINGLMFWLIAGFVKGFYITNYATAFWAALVYLLITWVTSFLFKEDED